MILFKTIHNDYVDLWKDYNKTSSFKLGARWNNASTPVLYTSSNAQNAMLEIANYVKSPKIVNRNFKLAVFQFPELRLHSIDPKELPAKWHDPIHATEVKALGDKYLLDPNWDGIVVPSATINREVATHSINTIRQSVYANVIVNPDNIGLDRITLIDKFSPIYCSSMIT